MKALRIYVYKWNLGDCTNNGISSKYNELLLVCNNGDIDIEENNLPENLVKIVTRELFGKVYKHIEPYKKSTKLGWMSGGNIGYSCDSRFRIISEYPLMIHDREE